MDKFLYMFCLPLLIYLIVFALITFPLIFSFNEKMFSDGGDGFQNLWNIWWIKKSVLELKQLPWHTKYLHYPHGVSLLGHTLNSFNGFIGILLFIFFKFNILQVYNFIVVFSFVTDGLFCFYLCYYLSKDYIPSIIGGFIFAFSSYNFLNMLGHLHLVSLEFIPLFILLWILFLEKPSLTYAVLTAISLFIVLLCSYYYFFCSIIAATIILFSYGISRKRLLFFLTNEYKKPFLIFIGTLIFVSGFIVIPLFILIISDPLYGAHSATLHSIDLAAFFIYGQNWRFNQLIKNFWPTKYLFNSIYPGLALIILTIYTWKKRKTEKYKYLIIWYIILIIFAILSLGPSLHFAGKKITPGILPYKLLETLLPFLKVTGVPYRFTVICFLSFAVIATFGFKNLFKSSKILSVILIVWLFIDYLPGKIPSVQLKIPDYVYKLKNLPHGAVIDTTTPHTSIALLHQTVHNKPIAFGYISRIPCSIFRKSRKIWRAFLKKHYSKLAKKYKFAYLVLNAKNSDSINYKLIYNDKNVKIFNLLEPMIHKNIP